MSHVFFNYIKPSGL